MPQVTWNGGSRRDEKNRKDIERVKKVMEKSKGD